MTQYSLSLDSDTLNAGALLVREAGGAVRAASRKEILTVARELVNVDELHGRDLSQPRLVKDFLRLRLNAALEHEVCGLILLDSQHRLIDYLEPFRGTINQASVYPREIVKISLHRNALSVFLVHNHPSGLAEASQADITLTKHLKQALALVDVRLLDHFIVAGSAVLSMAERGAFLSHHRASLGACLYAGHVTKSIGSCTVISRCFSIGGLHDECD